jgi:predicted nucleic acid-binding protein
VELADTSVWARRQLPLIAPWWTVRMLAGQIGICDQVKLEILHSTRSSTELRQVRQSLDALPQAPIDRAQWLRALDVYEALARAGPGPFHRSVKHADLLIAAAAEAAEWTLVHYDQDFEAIASVTGQAARWVVPRGTLP